MARRLRSIVGLGPGGCLTANGNWGEAVFEIVVGEFGQEVGRLLRNCLRPDHAALRTEVGRRPEVKGPGHAQREDKACDEVIGLEAVAFWADHFISDKVGGSAKRTFIGCGHTGNMPDAPG
jgi:hypothetical protein